MSKSYKMYLLGRLMMKARKRFPGVSFDYVGVCTSWEQCVMVEPTIHKAIFSYNIGKNTHTEVTDI